MRSTANRCPKCGKIVLRKDRLSAIKRGGKRIFIDLYTHFEDRKAKPGRYSKEFVAEGCFVAEG